MVFSSGHVSKSGNILVHRHHLSARQFLYERVAFLMIRMSMAAEYDLDIREFEPQLLNRISDNWNIAFVSRVNQDVALRGRHEVGGERFGSDIIDVVDHLMRRKLL